MIRQNLIAIQDRPSEGALAALASYRLFHEATTGLYYLMPFDAEAPERPDFGDDYPPFFPGKDGADLAPFDAFIAAGVKAGSFDRYQPGRDIVREAMRLSAALETRVLCMYGDDEEMDIAAVAKDGVLEYLRFKALPITRPADTPENRARLQQADKDGTQEMRISGLKGEPDPTVTETLMAGTFTPEAGFALEPYATLLSGMVSEDSAVVVVLEQVPGEMHFGLLFRNGELAFARAFGQPLPYLFDFGQPLPGAERLESQARRHAKPVEEIRAGYGDFTLVASAGRVPSKAEKKASGVFRTALKLVLIPVAFVIFLFVEIAESLRPKRRRK